MKSKPSKKIWVQRELTEPLFNTEVVLTTGNEKGNPLGAYVETQDQIVKGLTLRRYRVHICNPKDFYGLLHETVHLVCKIMTDRNIPFNSDNQEVIAYLQEHWFKLLWRELNKYFKRPLK